MVDIKSNLVKNFESLNKNLYRSNKVIELYKPMYEILANISKDLKEIEETEKKNSHLEKDIELEVKKRELISLFKKMTSLVSNLKEEMDYFYNTMIEGDKFLEKYRAYRTYVFEDTKKTHDFLKKLVKTFEISEFNLKFNVVGTIDLNDIKEKIKGKKIGVDIIVPSENTPLIFEEILKSNAIKFRLISDSIVIYFEKDTILHIEGPSKKIKLCDIDSKEFNAKLLDN